MPPTSSRSSRITLVIAYLSLVLGELVPKRIALQRAERFALAVAPTVDRFSKLMTPVIWLLSKSTNVVRAAARRRPAAAGGDHLRRAARAWSRRTPTSAARSAS